MIFQKGGFCKYNTISKNWEIGNNLGPRAIRYSSNEAEALNLLGLTSSDPNGLSQYYRDTNAQKIWGLNKRDTKMLSQIIDEIVKYANTDYFYRLELNDAIRLLVAAREGREKYPAEKEDARHAEYREGINRLIHLLSESQRNNGFIGNRNTSNRNRSTSKRNSRRNSRSKSNSRNKSRSRSRDRNGGNKKVRLTKKIRLTKKKIKNA